MRIPPPEDGGYGHNFSDTESQRSRRSNMLFFSTSRSDLGITMFIAAALCIATLVMFKLDGEVRLIDSYNNNMREAACTITSKHLQHLEIPIGPPDVDLPGQDQWRAEISVNVLPGDGSAPFEGYAHDTLQGAYDDVEDFQVHWLESFQTGETRTCYYGPVKGTEAVVFDLQSALTPDNGDAYYQPHSSYGLSVAKVVVAFFALLFAGMVMLKLLAGTWEPTGREEDDFYKPVARGEEAGGTVQGQPPRYVVDLQRQNGVGEPAHLDLRAGTPRSTEDSLDDISLGRGGRR